MDLKLILTKDGSHSIYNVELNETYHSTGGAINESQYIYIDRGLKTFPATDEEIKILEVGFGTGLNAILTIKESISNNRTIFYTTLEPYPISDALVSELNYPELLGSEYLKEKFHQLHSIAWESQQILERGFRILKRKIRLEEFNSSEKYNIIYYDAFAPSKQADIWSLDNLKKIAGLMAQDGILVTYCSSGVFKRNLKEAGLIIEILPGPLGKREITRARKGE